MFFARCLVHFALDAAAAYMATQLQGKETQFLPFNRDTENPIIYDRFAVSYLWADFTDTDGRTEVGVLDFVNEQETIQASFQDYYQRTELEGATDPNKLYNLKYTLQQMHVFTADDVEEFALLFIVQKVTSEKLQPFFQRIVETGYTTLGIEHVGKPDHAKLAAEAKEKFRKETAGYVKQYSFISQIMTFTDPKLEKFYLFAKLLLKQLPFERVTLPREVMDMVDMDKFRVQEEQNGSIALAEEDATLDVTSDDGHRGKTEEEKEKLKVIVEKLNADYAFHSGGGCGPDSGGLPSYTVGS